MFYVAFSRVTDLSKLFILGTFSRTFCEVNREEQFQLNRLRTEKKLKLVFENFETKKGKVFVYLNARSLRQNWEHINVDKWYQNADCLNISESNLCSSDNINLSNFKLSYRSDGPSRKLARGVCVFTKKNENEVEVIKKITETINNEHVDLVVYKIFDVIVVTGYSSPQTKTSTLGQIIESLLIDYYTDKTIFIGDFNVDNSKPNFLRDIMNIYGFQTIFSESTITTDYASQLDVIFTNFDCMRFGVYESYFSDHKPVFLEI